MSTETELSQLFLEKLSLVKTKLNSLKVAKDLNIDHQKIVGVIKSLASLPEFIHVIQVQQRKFYLTPEGKSILANGSHEWVVWNNVPEMGIEQAVLFKSLPDEKVAKVGFSRAMFNAWIAMEKFRGKSIIIRKANDVVDEVKNMLVLVEAGQYDEVS